MHFVGDLRLDHVLFAVIALCMPDGAVPFFDSLQNMGEFWARAAVWKDGIGQREFSQRNFAASKKCCRERAKRRFYSGIMRQLDHAIDAWIHPEPHGRAIFRFRECYPRRDWSLVTILSALRSPFSENTSCSADHDGAVIERRILNH